MSTPLKFAAIDIGSNAVRLLLSNVRDYDAHAYPQKISWIRMPIRLGSDAFTLGRISDEKTEKFIDVMIGFSYLIKAFQPRAVMACATAAMRQAENGPDICGRVLDRTGIPIKIIDGKKEADILFHNRPSGMLGGRSDARFLFVDVGGGSTEITIFSQGKAVASKSFNIGTIRLLKELPLEEVWADMAAWIKARADRDMEAIGSGGNINKLFRLAGGKAGRPASYKSLFQMKQQLETMTFEERMKTFSLRPDRADVIVPGSGIYLKVMEWAGCRKIHVPQRGLADGMIRALFEADQQGLKGLG